MNTKWLWYLCCLQKSNKNAIRDTTINHRNKLSCFWSHMIIKFASLWFYGFFFVSLWLIAFLPKSFDAELFLIYIMICYYFLPSSLQFHNTHKKIASITFVIQGWFFKHWAALSRLKYVSTYTQSFNIFLTWWDRLVKH